MPEKTEIAWAAGFFDGEGCVTIHRDHRRGREGYSLLLQVTQVDPRPLLEMKRLFDGYICLQRAATGNRAPLHSWRCSRQQAIVALTAMLPYLRVKREVAELAAAFQKEKHSRGTYGRGHLLAAGDLDTEAWYWAAIKTMNAKGVSRGGQVNLPVRARPAQLRLVG